MIIAVHTSLKKALHLTRRLLENTFLIVLFTSCLAFAFAVNVLDVYFEPRVHQRAPTTGNNDQSHTANIITKFELRIDSAIQNSTFQTQYNNQLIVSSAQDLANAVLEANLVGGNTEILIANGTYTLPYTLNVTADYVTVRSLSGRPESVILEGSANTDRQIGNLIRVSGDYFLLEGITLRNANNHLIQIAGEEDADYPIVRNCVLQDSYQQLLKVSYNLANKKIASDFGLVENSIFRYSNGIGPNWYIGGIDLQGGEGWIIQNNLFRDISSPATQVAEHAIHAWNHAANTVVENNTIVNSDRGIGFGMTTNEHSAMVYSHRGGLISNNLIVHTDRSDEFADVGIILEDSAETIVKDNLIWLGHSYPNAIEYRYSSSHSIIISGNRTNKAIRSRDGGQARLRENHQLDSLEELMEHMYGQVPVNW